MQVRLPWRDVPDVVRTQTTVRVGALASGPVYPPGAFRRTRAVEFFGAAINGTGGRVDTPSPGIAGLSDFTLSFLFTADTWVPNRGELADQRPDSWLLRLFQASGSPISGTWANGLQFWITGPAVSNQFRFMNIPMAAPAPTDVVQLVIRGRLALESSPGVLAPDAQRLQAWSAVNAASALTPVAATHGEAYSATTTRHPAALSPSTQPFRIGGSPNAAAWDWDGKILDVLCLPWALSDAEIAALRPGPNPAHFGGVVLSGGSWWRMGGGVGDADPALVDQGAAGDDGLLANGGAAGAQPVVVAV
jgi:hypothetical protein